MPDCFVVKVPMENVNDEVATIAEWNMCSGSAVRKGDLIAVLETMKATFEIEAEEDGFLFYEIAEGTEVSIGSDIAYICLENKRPDMKPPPAVSAKSEKPGSSVSVSAKAAKLMEQYGLCSNDFAGLQKVRVADVEAMISEKGLEKGAQHGKDRVRQKLPAHSEAAISVAKKYEIQQLSQSSRRVIPSSVTMMFDMHLVERKMEKISEIEGFRATVIELIIFEISRLLKKYRYFNGFYDNGRAILYDEINVGFAVNIGKGLKVPVIKNAATLSLKDISTSVKDLSLKYFREELGLDDLAGGTFTVTDLSAKGIIDFYPVINNRQSAILGICAVMPSKHHFKVILTFDHNMADGMAAADILNELSTLLQG